jgi:hypothetical protein
MQANEIRNNDKVRRPSGRLAQVRVAFAYTDSATDTEYMLVAYSTGGQDRFPIDQPVEIRR